MKHALAPSAVVLLTALAASAESPAMKVTVQLLLAHPTKFVGKRVDVTGYYHTSAEESSLFGSERASDQSRGCDDSIWLDPLVWDPRYYPRRPTGVARSEALDRRTVHVIGHIPLSASSDSR